MSAENLQSTATWTPAHAMTEKINDFRRPSGAAGSRIRDLGRLCSEGLILRLQAPFGHCQRWRRSFTVGGVPCAGKSWRYRSCHPCR